MSRAYGDLSVLICEDEYLLASDLAAQLGDRGIAVAGIASGASEALAALEADGFAANAVALDVQLSDGMGLSLVAPMLARGMAVVLCTGYAAKDLPPEFSHIPSVGKPTDVDRLLEAFSSYYESGASQLRVNS